MDQPKHPGALARAFSRTRRRSLSAGAAERRASVLEAETVMAATVGRKRIEAFVLRLGVDLGQLDAGHPDYLQQAHNEFHDMAQSGDEGESAAGAMLVAAIAALDAESGGTKVGKAYDHGIEFGKVGDRLGKALARFDPTDAAVIIRSLANVQSPSGTEVATRAAERLVAVFRAELSAAVRRLASHDDWADLEVRAPLVLLPEPLPTGLVAEAVGLPSPGVEWWDSAWRPEPDRIEPSPEEAFKATLEALGYLEKDGAVVRHTAPPRWSLTEAGRQDVAAHVHRWRRGLANPMTDQPTPRRWR